MPFITRLADDPRVDEVVVVAEVDVPPERRQMGWDSLYDANNRSCRIYLHPGDDDIRRLLDQRAAESWHIFMGIRAFGYVFHCLRLSMDYPVKRAPTPTPWDWPTASRCGCTACASCCATGDTPCI